jgi:uncharacterized membrane protein
MSESDNQTMPNATFSPAELAALAHLYRGEVYRSTVWRGLVISGGLAGVARVS